MKLGNEIKKVCEEQGLKIVDCNYYEYQPRFEQDFNSLTEGRIVAPAFLSNKILKARGRLR